MRKNLFKFIALLLLASIILVSCTSNKTNESTGIDDSKVTPKGEFPIVNKDTKIVITTKANTNVTSFDQGKNALTTWIAEETGVDIDINLYPEADASQKLNIEMSSGGDLGDLILGLDFDITMMHTYGNEGVLEPLQGYIEKYGDNLATALEEVQGARELCTAPDGNIYAAPYLGNVYNMYMPERMWINRDFLEKLDMEIPTTIDEFYSYLQAVKNTDLNGNGKNDEIPLLGATNEDVWAANPLHFLMNSFTLKDQNKYYVDNDEIHAAYAEEGWRSGLQWLNKIYSEGLMDPSVFTNDGNQLKTLVALEEGQTVGAVLAGGPHIIAQASDVDIRERYIAVDPLVGPSGLQFTPYQVFSEVSTYRAAIPAKSENKEVAFRVLDFLYSEGAWYRERYGEPGIDWETPESGTIAANGGPAKVEEINSIWGTPTDKHWQVGLTRAFTTSDTRAVLPDGEFDSEKVLFDAANSYSKYAKVLEVPKLFYDLDKTSDVNTWKTQLDDAVKIAAAEFITGARNPNNDSDWDAYISELKENGLEEYLEMTQSVFDKMWKGKYPYDADVNPNVK